MATRGAWYSLAVIAMINSLTKSDLIAFENEIADLFLAKQIRAPIHLSSGNEQQLIDIFEQHVNDQDYVLSNWRSHYHCLLKGVPPMELRQSILEGHSIALCFPKYRILSSAIVGGMAPIAVGLAMGIKRKSEQRKVVVFIGDMTSLTGIVHESMEYSRRHALPVLWIIEDDGRSVYTDTQAAWGPFVKDRTNVIRYEYRNKYPHVGLEKFVSF